MENWKIYFKAQVEFKTQKGSLVVFKGLLVWKVEKLHCKAQVEFKTKAKQAYYFLLNQCL